MSETFSIEKKKRLANKIEKLSTEELIKVKKIIDIHNPTQGFMKSSKGYFIKFQNLSDITYQELKKFLQSIEEKKIKEIESEILESSEYNYDNSIEIEELIQPNMSKKLRLTNTENHILSRDRYETELKKNDINSDTEFVSFSYENLEKRSRINNSRSDEKKSKLKKIEK